MCMEFCWVFHSFHSWYPQQKGSSRSFTGAMADGPRNQQIPISNLMFFCKVCAWNAWHETSEKHGPHLDLTESHLTDSFGMFRPQEAITDRFGLESSKVFSSLKESWKCNAGPWQTIFLNSGKSGSWSAFMIVGGWVRKVNRKRASLWKSTPPSARYGSKPKPSTRFCDATHTNTHFQHHTNSNMLLT